MLLPLAERTVAAFATPPLMKIHAPAATAFVAGTASVVVLA
jgi:hypothetical protein